MNGSEQNDWLEAGLRRAPTGDEQRRWEAYLAEHPEERAAWEEELRLNQIFRQLADAPVPTNFTAQVLAAVDRETPERTAAFWPVPLVRWFGHLNWAAVAALAALALTLGGLGYQRYQTHVRSELARSVATLTPVAALPTLEMLRNFEAINRLSLAPPVQDKDLLTASR